MGRCSLHSADEHAVVVVFSWRHFQILLFRKHTHCRRRKKCYLFLVCLLLIRFSYILTFRLRGPVILQPKSKKCGDRTLEGKPHLSFRHKGSGS